MPGSPHPSAAPVRLGVIGCGNVLDAYLPQAARLVARGLAEVTLACGRPSQRDRALALGARAFTTDEAELLQHPGIDAVLVLASMPEHARLAAAALRAGKHVLVEKPIATDLNDARDLLELARSTGRHLVCAPFTPLSPTLRALRHRIASGDIGKPCLARSRYGWAGPWWNEWFYQPGGGCLLDLGIYGITSLVALLGPVQRVTAFAGIAIPTREINGRTVSVAAEDNAQVLLDFGNATTAVVTTGFTIQQYRSPALEIYGTEGTLQMLGDDWDPDGYEWWQNSAGCWRTFKETHPDWSWTDGLRDLVEAIHSNRAPATDPNLALHVLEVILKARQSASDGRAFAIESTFDPAVLADSDPTRPLTDSHAAHLDHDRTREHLTT